jgi:hypothetical protein
MLVDENLGGMTARLADQKQAALQLANCHRRNGAN